MPAQRPSAMTPLPETGRIFVGSAVVRLGDVMPSGRLRLDAFVRHTQELSNDDTSDAGLEDDLAWVARTTRLLAYQHAVIGERLTLKTFCSGIGPKWAERRLSVSGDHGAHYEVATLWVSVDPTSGAPRKVSQQFHDLYGEAAGGRRVSARLTLPSAPLPGRVTPWPTRAVDFDTFDHMNNVVYWATVEDVLASRFCHADSTEIENICMSEAVVEYHAGIRPGSDVAVHVHKPTEAEDASDHLLMWWLADGDVCAVAQLGSSPG